MLYKITVIDLSYLVGNCHSFSKGNLLSCLEFSNSRGSLGVPTVCCFIPSLPPGSPFQISIHSWAQPPMISQYSRSYSDFTNSLKFEIRVFIDGRPTAFVLCVTVSHNQLLTLLRSTSFGVDTTWPQLISHSFG